MGFNRGARREAAAQQQQMFQLQQQQFAANQAAFAQYNSGFNTRNAGIINQTQQASNWLDRYSRGTDISELIPASIGIGQQASDTVKATVQAAGRMGDASQLPNDRGYQAKLLHIMGAQMGRGLAAVNETALQNERGLRQDTLFQGTQFLNQDRQYGLGLGIQGFNMANTLWQNATTRRNMEIQVANQAFGHMMQGLQFATGLASGAFGAGGFLRGLGGSGGGGAASGGTTNWGNIFGSGSGPV